jgi:hypothetical protein
VEVESQSGAFHFPLLDAENSTLGGPTITLEDPPGGICPFSNAKCTTAFYDDRGYHSTGPGGGDVGTLNSVLCGVNSPAIAYSDPVSGFDSSSAQRAFGQNTGGNANVPCQNGGTGSFGDVKGLDLWTYYPSDPGMTSLNIVAPEPAISIKTSASITEVHRDGKIDLGDSIAWSFLVTNTGTVSLTSIGVNDAGAGAVTCPNSTLRAGNSEVCTADVLHTITQADIKRGVVDTSATAFGTPTAGPTITSLPSPLTTSVANPPATLTHVTSLAVTGFGSLGFLVKSALVLDLAGAALLLVSRKRRGTRLVAAHLEPGAHLTLSGSWARPGRRARQARHGPSRIWPDP